MYLEEALVRARLLDHATLKSAILRSIGFTQRHLGRRREALASFLAAIYEPARVSAPGYTRLRKRNKIG